MGSRRSDEWFGHLETLFRDGAIGGLSDARLLERFLAARDEAGEAAFRALVERHGPMVLRVCRGVLHNPDDAEEAFQVTFLALARKAGSIRKHASIASWLHGTAHRVAPEGADRGPAAAGAGVAGGGGRRVARVAGFRRGPRGLADPPRGDRATAREIPGADRALLPGGDDPRPGGRRAGLAGRDGPRPPGAGAGPPEVAPDPPRPGGLGRAGGLGRRRPTRPRSGCRRRWSRRRSAPRWADRRSGNCRAPRSCSRRSSATWPSPDGSGSSRRWR